MKVLTFILYLSSALMMLSAVFIFLPWDMLNAWMALFAPVAYPATPLVQYQVFAKSGTGEWIWALRTAWPRPPFPEAQKEAMISSFAERNPNQELTVDDFDWPEHTAALSAVQVDGHGRIYVFPLVSIDEDTNDDDEAKLMPVDVYSPEGERLMAGLISDTWTYARGDYVYTMRPTSDDEVQIVRYRLVLPED